MRTVRVLDEAATEAEEAVAWYEQERSALGSDFQSAVDAALDLLQEDLIPSTAVPGGAGKQGLQRLVLTRFPYDVIFVERPDHILVLAIAHHSRRPGFWRQRLRT